MLDGINLAFNIGYQAEGFVIRQALRIEPLQDLLGIDEIESLSPEALRGESMTVITGQESGLNLIDTLVNFIHRIDTEKNKAVSIGIPFADVIALDSLTERLAEHEGTHVADQRQEGLAPWAINYITRLAVDTVKKRSFDRAYNEHPDETKAKEAANRLYPIEDE